MALDNIICIISLADGSNRKTDKLTKCHKNQWHHKTHDSFENLSLSFVIWGERDISGGGNSFQLAKNAQGSCWNSISETEKNLRGCQQCEQRWNQPYTKGSH